MLQRLSTAFCFADLSIVMVYWFPRHSRLNDIQRFGAVLHGLYS
jgi:hypothetical protein